MKLGGTKLMAASAVGIILVVAPAILPRAQAAERFGKPQLAQVEVPEIQDLRAAVNSQDVDKILTALNDLKRMGYKGKVLPYLQSLWRGQEDTDQGLNWGIVALPLVKVEIANILLQAERNGLVDLNPEEYHTYVKQYALDDDTTLSRSSILTLSILNDEKDVPVLVEAARKENPATFGAAILALSYMCNPSASRALDELREAVVDEGSKGYLGGLTPAEFIESTESGAASVRRFYGGDCE